MLNSHTQPNTLSESSGPPEIRPEEIVLDELIGSGSFGKVCKRGLFVGYQNAHFLSFSRYIRADVDRRL